MNRTPIFIYVAVVLLALFSLMSVIAPALVAEYYLGTSLGNPNGPLSDMRPVTPEGIAEQGYILLFILIAFFVLPFAPLFRKR